MRRRLAAAGLFLALHGCGPASEPAQKPPPAPPPVAPPVSAAKAAATPSPTLQAVRRRGRLICGVNPGLPGFAYPDVRGVWRGFDVDICHAVAAAVLGDAAKVEFAPVKVQDRFDALRRGRIDLLSRNTSWTLGRDAGEGVDFPVVTYYDGQGFLAPRALGLSSAEELVGARICVQAGTASQTNLSDYFAAHGMKLRAVPVETAEAAVRLYQNDGCDVYTSDLSALTSARSVMNSPNAQAVLPDVISKEPLGPVVRQDDPAWSDIVRWTVFALILAEEKKLSTRTVDRARAETTDPETRRLLGVEGDLGPLLGLPPDWAYQAIRQVGAYDEIFARNLGADSPLKLERGLNALWNAPAPGLLYAPPVR